MEICSCLWPAYLYVVHMLQVCICNGPVRKTIKHSHARAETTANHKLIREITCIWFHRCNQTLRGSYFYHLRSLSAFGSILGMSISWQIYSRNQYVTLQLCWVQTAVSWWDGANRHSTGNYNTATMSTNTNWTNEQMRQRLQWFTGWN